MKNFHIVLSVNNYIEHIIHEGVVSEIDLHAHTVRVHISNEAGCGGCPAATLCGVTGGNHGQILEVRTPYASTYRAGEKVRLCGTERMHRKAILLATVLPSICLVAVMIIVYLLTFNQLMAALSGVGTMIFFFTVLYLLRNRIAHEFTFTIEKE